MQHALERRRVGYWGDDPGQACVYANVYDKTATSVLEDFDSPVSPHHECDDCYAVTSPVGRFKPNAFNLYDVMGNVWEWTCSEYDKNYGGAEKRCVREGNALRSLRGGSWDYLPWFVRSAMRNWSRPSFRSVNLGIRLAQDI